MPKSTKFSKCQNGTSKLNMSLKCLNIIGISFDEHPVEHPVVLEIRLRFNKNKIYLAFVFNLH